MGAIDLAGKVGIVTGGARGIGAAYAIASARAGASVMVADLLDGSDTVSALGENGASVITDVSEPASVDAMVDATLERFGRVDFIVNNAAIYAGLKPTRYDRIELDEWDRVMAVNVRGVYLCCRSAARPMVEQGSGSIINISSGTVHQGTPGVLHYVTSKAAVLGMTRALSRELGARGVRVNTITPGFTGTDASESIVGDLAGPMASTIVSGQAIARLEQPEDLVGAVVFLASDASAFITGQTINVDGGWAHT